MADDAAMSDLLTVSEAATVAGVSVRTMRRRVANGQVRTVGRGRGRLIVAASLSGEAAIADTNGQSERPALATEAATTDKPTDSGQEADRLALLVRELSERLAEQAAVAAMWQERARVLADQLALSGPSSDERPPAGPSVWLSSLWVRRGAVAGVLLALAVAVAAGWWLGAR